MSKSSKTSISSISTKSSIASVTPPETSITHAVSSITSAKSSITTIASKARISHSKTSSWGVNIIFILFPKHRVAGKWVKTHSHGHVIVHEVVAHIIRSHPIAWSKSRHCAWTKERSSQAATKIIAFSPIKASRRPRSKPSHVERVDAPWLNWLGVETSTSSFLTLNCSNSHTQETPEKHSDTCRVEVSGGPM